MGLFGSIMGSDSAPEPPYTVLHARAQVDVLYEIRQYDKRFIAETSKGFPTLAKYFGIMPGGAQNEKKQSITMTAPVATTNVKRRDSKMRFVLPQDMQKRDSIPSPKSGDVEIVEVPAKVGAVYRYSGSSDEKISVEKAKELAKQLREDGFDVTEQEVLDNFEFWVYNPPFTLSSRRRNEIWFPLNEAEVERIVNGFKACEAN